MKGEERIAGHVVLEGELELLSPLLVGDGGGDETRDIHVLKDRMGCPFLPGTSIAGVLRGLLAERSETMASLLFGALDRWQSAVRVSDAVFTRYAIIYRDGVRIDHDLGTAVTGAKYDYEAIERGGRAPLRIDVTLRGIHTDDPSDIHAPIRTDVLDALVFLRDALKAGVRFGAMTAKGLGRAQVKNIAMGLYDFARPQDVKAYLRQETPTAAQASDPCKKASTYAATAADTFDVTAAFSLRSSLLVRAKGEDADGKTIAVMQKSGRDAVIPGSSMKGVLRHQAMRILEKLGRNADTLDALMGSSGEDATCKQKSRMTVDETYIRLDKNVFEKEHTRNRIDRFTGGTIDSALFTTRPIWQKGNAPTVHVHFQIQKASKAEAGLALFLLRDLWQGRIALGGEVGSGRGTLAGHAATIRYGGVAYHIGENGRITDGKAELEAYAAAFVQAKED